MIQIAEAMMEKGEQSKAIECVNIALDLVGRAENTSEDVGEDSRLENQVRVFLGASGIMRLVGHRDRALRLLRDAFCDLKQLQSADRKAALVVELLQFFVEISDENDVHKTLSYFLKTLENTSIGWDKIVLMCKACIVLEDFEQAFDIVELFECEDENTMCESTKTDVLVELANALGNVESKAKLARILAITDEGVSSPQYKIKVFVKVAEVLSSMGDEVQARKLLHDSWDMATDLKPDLEQEKVCARLIGEFLRMGYLETASTAAQQMDGKQYKTRALAEVAEAFLQAGNRNLAYQTILYSLSLKGRDHQESKEFALIGIAQALAQVGEVETSLNVVEEMSGHWYKAQALSVVAQILVDKGAREQGRVVFSLAISEAESVDASYTKCCILSTVARRLARVGFVKLAYQVFTQTVAVAEEMAPSLSGLLVVVREAARSGAMELACETIERALAFVDRMKPGKDKDKALSQLVTMLAQVGEFERALALAETIISDFDAAEAFANIVRILAEPDTSTNGGLFWATVSAFNDINNSGARLSQSNVIAQALARIGDFDLAIEYAEVIKSSHSRSRALASIALPAANSGLTELSEQLLSRALTVAEGSMSEGARSVALGDVARTLAQVGDFDRALRAARAISESGGYGKHNVLKDIAEALVQQSFLDKKRIVAWCQDMFRYARGFGRKVAFEHIRAFVPVIAVLGDGELVCELWETVRQGEGVIGSSMNEEK
jgi:tetratricopeptide (TPR) repeat protein